MRYSVILSRTAKKQFHKINRPNQLKIGKAIDLLADNPYPSGRVLLKSKHTFWRISVGDFRIIYQVVPGCSLSLVAKNLFNDEYMGRPGDIQPPRNITLQAVIDL